jgi:hypothetical protein
MSLAGQSLIHGFEGFSRDYRTADDNILSADYADGADFH